VILFMENKFLEKFFKDLLFTSEISNLIILIIFLLMYMNEIVSVSPFQNIEFFDYRIRFWIDNERFQAIKHGFKTSHMVCIAHLMDEFDDKWNKKIKNYFHIFGKMSAFLDKFSKDKEDDYFYIGFTNNTDWEYLERKITYQELILSVWVWSGLNVSLEWIDGVYENDVKTFVYLFSFV